MYVCFVWNFLNDSYEVSMVFFECFVSFFKSKNVGYCLKNCSNNEK